MNTNYSIESRPWRQGGVAEAATTVVEALEKFGLNWQVEKVALRPVRLEFDNYMADHAPKTEEGCFLSRSFCTVRTDINIAELKAALGVVGVNYTPVQNSEAFDFLDLLLSQRKVVIDSAGELGHGQKVWVCARLLEGFEVGPDKVVSYLVFINSHDGSSGVQCFPMPIRLLCSNVLTTNFRSFAGKLGAKSAFRIMHTRSARRRLSQATQLMEKVMAGFDGLKSVFEEMAGYQPTDRQKERFFNLILPPVSRTDPSWVVKQKTVDGRRAQILRRLERSTALKGHRDSLWGFYNAAVEHVDYDRLLVLAPGKQLSHLWFGSGAAFKEQALTVAVDLMHGGLG